MTAGVMYNLTRKDTENIKGYVSKFPSLSYREILVMYKYVPKEKLEKALFEVSNFMTVEEYLNKICGLTPVKIFKDLYS